MGQALYRDWRPRSFDEVVGQDHITTTLKKAIDSGRISHAYLFTGPRGVGKTSIARILAHSVNNLPYNDDSMQLDIIEIDAASNNGVEDVRELREKVHVTPTSAKYKVYIIDEVHMLSKAAFNALLKTLEEPPAHVIFILATTESHKVPETIVSRTQRFEFKPISSDSATKHLAAIAKKEKIKVDEGALELLAEHGEGSFRDSIGLLDQLRSISGEVSEESVREFLGVPPEAQIDNLLAAVSSGDSAKLMQTMDSVRTSGANAALIAKLLAKRLRQELIQNTGQAWVATLLRTLIEVPASFSPDDSLEIALLEACGHAAPATQKPAAMAAAPAAPVIKIAEAKPTEPVKKEAPKAVPKASLTGFDEDAWEQIVERVKDQAASLYTALRLATPEASDGKLTLAFQFPLHQKKVDQAQHKDLIGRVVAEVTGQNLTVEPVVDASKKKAEAPAPVKKPRSSPEPLETISNIFGATEVLES